MDGTVPRSGRGLKIALALSVAVNLLVLGLFAGTALRGGRDRDLGFGPFAAALTEADRDALRREFRARMPDLRAARAGQRQAMAAVLAALRAEPFDAPGLERAMAAAADQVGERLRIGQDLLVRHLTGMTPAERAAFADRLEASTRRGPRHDRPQGP